MNDSRIVLGGSSGINLDHIDVKINPALIELTPTNPKIYGYVKNIYFGPNISSMNTFSLNQPGIRRKLQSSIIYEYSNRIRNEVKGIRAPFFEPNNYNSHKYAVRVNELQLYPSIPIYRMSITEAINVAKKQKGVIFCNNTPLYTKATMTEDNYDPLAQKNKLSDLPAFEIVWIDKLPDVYSNHYNKPKTKTITYTMFHQYISEPFNDFSQLNFEAVYTEGKNNYEQRIEKAYQRQDQKLSENLFMNLMRLSIDQDRMSSEGRVSAIISYLGGGKTRSRSRIRRHRKTRKN